MNFVALSIIQLLLFLAFGFNMYRMGRNRGYITFWKIMGNGTDKIKAELNKAETETDEMKKVMSMFRAEGQMKLIRSMQQNAISRGM